jgi:hypothetical protein
MGFNQNSSFGFGSDGGGGGGGSTQKQPLSFKVGVTPGAPVAGAMTWQLPAFENSYLVLVLNRTTIDLSDMGDGAPYITKSLESDTATVSNYGTGWADGDVLTYILITP